MPLSPSYLPSTTFYLLFFLFPDSYYPQIAQNVEDTGRVMEFVLQN